MVGSSHVMWASCASRARGDCPLLTRLMLLWSLSVGVLLAWQAAGAEVLVSEDFEKLDLKQLPSGWTIVSANDFSIVDEAGRGKVLRISHKGGGWPQLAVALDANKVRGHVVRISALAKFPGGYTPLPDKTWARPKIMLTFKDKDGKDHYCGGDLEPNKPEWQQVSNSATIDKDAQAIGAYLRIDLVAAEAFFDDFRVELDPDGVAPKTATPAAGTNPKPATGAPAGNEAAAKAPKRTLEEGGALFGPEIAGALQKIVKPGSANSFAVIGPGLPLKEMEGKTPDKWTRLPNSKEVAGATAGPRVLLATLPDFLAKSKPEVVFVVGEITTTRKTAMLEALDWEDVARVCLRMGVVPVLVVPPAAPAKEGPIGMAEDVRTGMTKAAEEAKCPAIDLKTLATVHRLVTQMLGLLDKHVFCRVPLDQPGADTKKLIEE